MNYHHGNLRQALLSAASQRLDEQGHAAFSLSELAREVGVTPAAVYRHFADKQSINDCLAEHGFDLLYERFAVAMPPLKTLPDAHSAMSRFAALGTAYVDFAISSRGLLQLMFGHSGEAYRRAFNSSTVAQRASTFQFLTQSLAELHAAKVTSRAASDADAQFVWSAIHGTALLCSNGTINASHPRRLVADICARCIAALSVPNTPAVTAKRSPLKKPAKP